MKEQSEILFQAFISCTGVTIDNRTIVGGELFFGLQGEHSNGGEFAQAALNKGAILCVVDNIKYKINDKCIVVEDALVALQNLARAYRNTFGFPVFAITGSNGKTTTKELMRAVLSKKYRVFATKGNLNNHIGVPLSILSVPRDCNFAIIEMGANHQKEIEFYCTIAEPDFGLITNIGKAHLEGFGGEDGVLKGKSELFQYVMSKDGTLFSSSSQTKLLEVVGKYAHVINYGFKVKDYLFGKLLHNNGFATVEVDEKIQIHSNLTGDYNVENMLAAACVGKYFGVSYENITAGIESYMPDNNRSELKEINGNFFILDAYNANPSSMQVAIENLQQMKSPNKIAILGDMLEMGDYAEQEHQQILQQALEAGFNLIVTVGPEFGKLQNASVLHFNIAEEARNWWRFQAVKGATILLKGSRGIKLERILQT